VPGTSGVKLGVGVFTPDNTIALPCGLDTKVQLNVTVWLSVTESALPFSLTSKPTDAVGAAPASATGVPVAAGDPLCEEGDGLPEPPPPVELPLHAVSNPSESANIT